LICVHCLHIAYIVIHLVLFVFLLIFAYFIGLEAVFMKGHLVLVSCIGCSILLWFSVVWSVQSSCHSSWLLTQRYRVPFPALPDFMSSSGSGTGSTQPL
jgi:antibiotic biosynthesis monooxygenase (ABM) superfamily enzyme